MSTSSFQFKQFTIQQDRCAMKVGTDGVLIGSWCNVHDKKQCLDIGTGTGLIALMVAQRNPQIQVDAIDIDKDATTQASENIQNSPFSKRISVYCTDLLYYSPQKQYDIIVSNPPFYQEDTKSGNSKRDISRHTDSLPFELLLSKSSTLLTPDGELSLIIPHSASSTLISTAAMSGLYLKRRTDIRSKSSKPPKRTLLTFCKSITLTETSELIITENSKYTAEYTALTSEFYLSDKNT